MTNDTPSLNLKQSHAIIVHHHSCAGVMRYLMRLGEKYGRSYSWWFARRCPYLVLSCITADELRNESPSPFMCANDDELREVIEQEEEKSSTPIQFEIIVTPASEYERTIRDAITSDDVVRVDAASMPEPEPKAKRKPVTKSKRKAKPAKKTAKTSKPAKPKHPWVRGL